MKPAREARFFEKPNGVGGSWLRVPRLQAFPCATDPWGFVHVHPLWGGMETSRGLHEEMMPHGYFLGENRRKIFAFRGSTYLLHTST